jgi:tripeptide aminopeptidase
MMKSTIHRPRAEALVMRLMAIPGKSCEESAAAQFIVGQLLSAGLARAAIGHDNAHKASPFGGQRGNLIVKLGGSRGRTREARRMLMAHIDTVPICVGCRPVKKGAIVRSADPTTGLGGDDRAGAAAILTALLEILRNDLPHPPLTFLWCVQEEIGLMGARNVDRKKLGSPLPSAAFNFDGSRPADITIGATGAYRAVIRITGVPAHAGVHPEEGVSAITIASLAIARLEREGWHGLVEKDGKRGTSNVGVFHAGDATNVITEAALLRAEMRSHDPKFRKRILDAYRGAFSDAARQVRNSTGKRGKVRFEVSHDYESFALSTSDPAVVTGAAAVTAAGLKPNFRISNGGLDANWMNRHGIPTVSFGCGQRDIHTAREYLDLPDYFTGCEVALRLATKA